MSATSLGLGGNPIKFLGAFVKSVNSNLGLTQSPGSASVTLAEDECTTPKAIFRPPTLGEFVTLEVGSEFKFSGVITKFEKDIRNVSGRFITVDIADVREIMANMPVILAPGYRTVADHIKTSSECSIIDVFGAFDDEAVTGLNLSGWNQSGMPFRSIREALTGGKVVIQGVPEIPIPAQGGKAFGEKYFFNITEVSAFVNDDYRLNANLITMADLIQDLASTHSFDWYVEANGVSGSDIEIKIKTIDRRTDNTDINLQAFLANNSGLISVASSGVELRNEIACSVLLGAPVEQIRTLNVDAMANTPVDLSDEGGDSEHIMSEIEMRVVLGNREAWEFFGKAAGIDYGIGGLEFRPIKPPELIDSPASAIGKAANKRLQERIDKVKEINAKTSASFEDVKGRIYDKLKGAAESSYGKRFIFATLADVDYIDAAWTADAIGGNNNANEYFRNDEGKTRCYVEFVQQGVDQPGTQVIVNQSNLGLGIGGGFTIGRPGKEQNLTLLLADSFDLADKTIETDKVNYLINGTSLFVAATIEESRNIVKLEAPVLINAPEIDAYEEIKNSFTLSDDKVAKLDADGNSIPLDKKEARRLKQVFGFFQKGKIHGLAYQPKFVHVPTRAKFVRYGPVFASNIVPDSQGKLVIDQDEGFAPWEFGGTTVMLDAMQFKVDNQSSNVREIQTASITIEGFPQFSIGESLGMNSNINSISISLSGQVTTTYSLQSFQRKFGELTKEELAMLSLFARRGGARNLPQDTLGFIEKFRSRVNTQFSGKGTLGSSTTMGGAFSFE